MQNIEFDLEGLGNYQTDRDLESEEGIWLKFPGDRKIHVLRAGGSNKKFSRVLSTRVKPYRRQMDRGTLDPEISDNLMLNVYLDTVVLGWSGFKTPDGVEIPYSREAGYTLFKALPEMFDEVMSLASDAASFQEQEVEEVADTMGES
jgi:hypothetical protein